MAFGRPHRKLRLWQLILFGPFLIWSGIHSYNRLDAFEQSGGTMYIGRFDHLLYSLGGKTFVLVFWLGLGGFYLWALWRFIRLEREAKAAIQRADASAQPVEGTRSTPVGPPLPSPPRLGDDPFRDPPRRPIIVAERTVKPVAPIQVVPGDPDDKPKLLT